jgi:hypothetical protein
MRIGVPKPSKRAPGDLPELETERTVCGFFSCGLCKDGHDCRFLHVVPR